MAWEFPTVETIYKSFRCIYNTNLGVGYIPFSPIEFLNAFNDAVKNLWLPQSWSGRFQNQGLRLQTACSTCCGPTGIKDWSWVPRHRRNADWAQSTLGKLSVGFPEPAHSREKHWLPLLTAHLHWTHKSTTKNHFREATFCKRIPFGLWFGKSGAEPWKQIGLYQTGNDFSLDIQRRECCAGLCRNYYPPSTLLGFTTAGFDTMDLGTQLVLGAFVCVCIFVFHINSLGPFSIC